MAHYKLILAYDGTDYHGFQRQAGKASVQAALEAALRQIGWQGRAVLPAGRTDSGVHASGQVVSFQFDWKHEDFALQNALNATLPPAIAVRSLCQVSPGFHPRYDALSRSYRYQLYAADTRDPLRDRYAWRLNELPDVGLMNAAAADLPGEHDFRAFGKALKEDGTTIRIIQRALWQRLGSDGAAFEITGNAFLYHMVRRLVYVMVAIGQGRQPVELIRRGLQEGSTGIVALAPGRGLNLVAVTYGEEKKDGESTLRWKCQGV